MLLYYLEDSSSVSKKGLPVFYNGKIDSEADCGTFNIRNALFYTSEEKATAEIPIANDWWIPYNFCVKSISLEELLGEDTQFKFGYIGKIHKDRIK